MIIGPVTLISSIPNRIVPFELVTSAAYRIRNGIEKTPCDVSLVRYELFFIKPHTKNIYGSYFNLTEITYVEGNRNGHLPKKGLYAIHRKF